MYVWSNTAITLACDADGERDQLAGLRVKMRGLCARLAQLAIAPDY
jgi:hypothetical protein